MHEQPLYCGIEGEGDGLGFMVHLIVIVTSNPEGGTAAVTRGILFGANSETNTTRGKILARTMLTRGTPRANSIIISKSIEGII
jgi:hypothetical protein